MWATGRKTLDERISQGPSAAIEVPGANPRTVLELAQQRGKATGNVSTAEITDATPAVLASHISLRGCQGPADAAKSCPTETKAAGGLGSIAEQMVDHEVDVTLGGGRARFEQATDAGPTVLDGAAAKSFNVITDARGLAAARPGKPLLGRFTTGDMTMEWDGPIAVPGDGTPAQRCDTNHRRSNEPSLVDRQDHAANACAQIGETVAFDRAVGVALDYQRTHPDTLIVVTADHAHTPAPSCRCGPTARSLRRCWARTTTRTSSGC